MTKRDLKEFGKLMDRMGAVHMRTIDPDLVDAYFGALRFLPIESVRRAIDAAIQDSPYFPKPAELRTMAHVPEKPRPQEVDGQLVYACLNCLDLGVKLTERFRPDGRSLGVYAAPCSCVSGQITERAWQKPDSRGQAFADAARDNTRKLREHGALSYKLQPSQEKPQA